MEHYGTILLVEDDISLANWVAEYLIEQGYQTTICQRGDQVVEQVRKTNPDLVLLDIMLPGQDGISVCRDLRQFYQAPIIMLTAKGDEVDRIIGLEMGADDYLPKPFNPRELLARAKAVLRRRSSEAPGAPSKDIQIIEFGEYKLNLATREMISGDTPLTLTSGEFAVLKSLVTHPREPLSRDKLMNLARGRDYSALERSIDVQVSRLRRMLEEDPANPRYIQTVWGLGYVFVPDGEQV